MNNEIQQLKATITYYQFMEKLSSLLLNDTGYEYILRDDRWKIVTSKTLQEQMLIINMYIGLEDIDRIYNQILSVDGITSEWVHDTIRRRVASTI